MNFKLETCPVFLKINKIPFSVYVISQFATQDAEGPEVRVVVEVSRSKRQTDSVGITIEMKFPLTLYLLTWQAKYECDRSWMQPSTMELIKQDRCHTCSDESMANWHFFNVITDMHSAEDWRYTRTMTLHNLAHGRTHSTFL